MISFHLIKTETTLVILVHLYLELLFLLSTLDLEKQIKLSNIIVDLHNNLDIHQ
jgi:hypothetical protein